MKKPAVKRPAARWGREEEERIMYNWYPNYKMSLPTTMIYYHANFTGIPHTGGFWYTVSTAITNSKSLHFTCLDSATLLTPSKEIFVDFEVKMEGSEEPAVIPEI